MCLNNIHLIWAHWVTSCLFNTLFGYEDRLYAWVLLKLCTEQRTGLIQLCPILLNQQIYTDTHTHTCSCFALCLCTKAVSSSCLVFRWLHRCRQRWVVVSPVCVWPQYSGSTAMTLGVCLLIFTVGKFRPQMAVEWSWSFQRCPRLLLQSDSSCLCASSLKSLVTAWFLFASGKVEAVKSCILFWFWCDLISFHGVSNPS